METMILKIDTDEPIPISVFNKSLEALGHQFLSVTDNTSDLYISKLRQGSYIVELVTVATVATLPIINNINAVVQFIEYVSTAKKWLMGQTDKPKDIKISQDDLAEFKKLLAPALVINNYGSISFSGNSEAVKFEKDEVREITNKIDRTTVSYEIPEYVIPISDNYQKVLFYWYQTGFDDRKINQGNKGIIEAIDSKAKAVIFADDDSETKKEMTTIHPEVNINWQTIGYIVDVEVIKKGNEIKCYKILKNYMKDCIID